jgi:hypothetical protein
MRQGPRRVLGPLAACALASVGLAACGTPPRHTAAERSTTTTTTTPSTTTTTLAALGGPALSGTEEAKAAKVNFDAHDFPSGWTPSGLGSLVAPVLGALSACPTLEGELSTGWAVSPAFEAPLSSSSAETASSSALPIQLALSAVAFAKSSSKATGFVSALATSSGLACVRDAVTTGLAKVPGLSVQQLTVDATTLTLDGRKVTRLTLGLTEQVGKVSLPMHLVLELLSDHRVVAEASFVDLSNEPSIVTSLSEDLARRA